MGLKLNHVSKGATGHGVIMVYLVDDLWMTFCPHQVVGCPPEGTTRCTGKRDQINDEVPRHRLDRTQIRWAKHYNDVIMGTITSRITGVSIVYSTACSAADERKHESSAALAFVRGIHRWPVNSPHNWPVTRKMVPFDDVIMKEEYKSC